MEFKTIKNNVLFVIWGLRPGGAERAFVNIVNNIEGNINPTIVVLGNKEGFAHELRDDLDVYYLNKKKRRDVFWLVIKLISIVQTKKPDSILSFGYYANQLVILANILLGQRTPVCIREQTDTDSSLHQLNFQAIRKTLLKMLYKKADKIIAVSYKIRNNLINQYDINQDNIKVIYNPIDLNKVNTFASERVDHPWFYKHDIRLVLAVGRLVTAKGFTYLLGAFSHVSKIIENARLMIIGEGEKREILENLIFKLGCKDKVALLGFQKNPYKFMARSDIFVLSSIYEGFPNVILEAMACGIPVISTYGFSGPDEIIVDQINGLLVSAGNEKSLAEAMIQLLRNSDMCDRFSRAGRERIKDFSLKKIIYEYEKLLNTIINKDRSV